MGGDNVLTSLLSNPTAVRTDRLASYLNGYPPNETRTLTNGLRHGFRLDTTVIAACPERVVPVDVTVADYLKPQDAYANHRSALDNRRAVDRKIEKEVVMGRIAGPFTTSPFDNLIVSPLGAVPKKLTGEYRLIHDLSFPKRRSVNFFFDPQAAKVSYECLDHCVDIIMALGRGTLVSKVDLKDAFRIIPIHTSSHHLLGFTWNNAFYYDKHLPMGCTVSCSLFESLSRAVQWILINKLHVQHMSHILDDFIFFTPANCKKPANPLNSFLQLALSLNLPVKHEKTVLPSTIVVLHGIEVDTLNMTLRLPLDKLCDARQKVRSMAKRVKVTLVELQSLLGTLNFACRVIVPGRAFLRRLHDLTRGGTKPDHWIRITAAARGDLQAWMEFLEDFNGRAMFLPSLWSAADTIHLGSDASKIACAAVLKNKWFKVVFPPSWDFVKYCH